MTGINPYHVLEIPYNASPRQIRKAKRRLLFLYHPDRNPGNLETAERKTRQILEAAKILENPERRRQYDTVHRSYRSTRRETPADAGTGDSARGGDAGAPMICPHCGYKNFKLAHYGRCMLCGYFILARPETRGGIAYEKPETVTVSRQLFWPRRIVIFCILTGLFFIGLHLAIRYGTVYLAEAEVYEELRLGKKASPISLKEFRKIYENNDMWRVRVQSQALGYDMAILALFIGVWVIILLWFYGFILSKEKKNNSSVQIK